MLTINKINTLDVISHNSIFLKMLSLVSILLLYINYVHQIINDRFDFK